FDSKSGPDAITGEERDFDYDGDGLENYQEYWMNAVYHFQYDKWTAGLGYGAYDPAQLFSAAPLDWDWSGNADYSEMNYVPYYFIPIEVRLSSPYGPVCYACTDPRMHDSDEDGMDDFYEMFHGLNPLLSQNVDLVGKMLSRPPDIYDFRTHPWLAGMQNADPDQDGIPNYEEMLMPNRPEPANHHTDPSPLWFTDTSYANSFVNLYYNLGSMPMYWTEGEPFPDPVYMVDAPPFYMYTFEINEGYDTDNDNLQDKQEIISSTEPGLTDPLDMDLPRHRKALYLNGVDAAARTRIGFAYGPDALRSWTIEAWVRPVKPASGRRQVIIERPVQVLENDPMPAPDYVRRTFRLGLEWNGAPFVEYDNDGKVVLTERAVAMDWPLTSTNWTHLAATMNGVEKRLTLYVNGKVAKSVPTENIPCTGFIDGTTYIYNGAPLVIGAADSNPLGSVNGSFSYINGNVYSEPSQPALRDFYKGWIDEVRVWDGAREQSEIVADLNARKRYTRDDVIASRETAVARLRELLARRGFDVPPAGLSFDEFYVDAAQTLMQTGGETPASRLPPTLLSHYSFDNLPDPRYEPLVPAGFDRLNGRPTVDYPGVPWWLQAADRSTVYRTFDANPYLFVHWIENTVATLPIGHLSSNGTFVASAALDSHYWKRYSTGGVAIEEGYENVFNNTANPYGLTYKHGDSMMTQVDTEDVAARFDPMSDSQYNHLLPLRGAVADMSVPLWDNDTPGSADYDSDNDGMPDDWELANGLDPNDPADAGQDLDGDGLSNLQEFFAGTSPASQDSDGDGIPDYEDTSPGSARMNGVRFTDNDYVEDAWESGFDAAYASPFRYDEHLDLDGDGWNNWSEARAGFAAGVVYRPDAVRSDLDTNGVSVASYPTPTLRVRLDYFGIRNLREYQVIHPVWPMLVVHAYTDPYMNGMPDAVYNRHLLYYEYGDWPLQLVLTEDDLTIGHIRQGRNYFYAFIDLDGSTIPTMDTSLDWRTWTPGEPAGLADNHDKGIDIGWDRNEVRFGLTDEARSFARFSWEDSPYARPDVNRVSILNHSGTEIFVGYFSAPRTWLHEGDLIAGKEQNFGLGWGQVFPPRHIFKWRLNGAIESTQTFTNDYLASLPVPATVAPKNDVLAGARTTYLFRLHPEATEFEFELRRGTIGGTVVYSGRHLAPSRGIYDTLDGSTLTDVCSWRFPYHAGDVLPNGQVLANDTYYWRVRGFSPTTAAGTAWSDQPSFRLDVNASATDGGGKGWLTVNVRYPGAAGLADGAPIRVQAFATRAFNGIPDAEKQIAAPGNVTLAGLEPGVYYIRAYVDQNNNRRRDFWESYGYYRSETDPVEPFRVKGVQVVALGMSQPLTVTIRDADTDNDKIPDALEYVMHGAGGGDWLAVAGPGPIASSDPYTDFDGDGLNDLSELDAGTRWDLADSDGDGIPDRLDRDLFGIDASIQGVRQVLQLTGLDPAESLLGWRWTTREALESGLAPLAAPAAEAEVVPLGRSVNYVIEFTPSLTQPDWQPVTNLSSVLSGGRLTLPRTTTPSGFYRIKLLAE
ncbi:MAG: LamG-like jellyroll fold domain-containing protein, partial [Kiritimatiellia bacterium]